MKMTEFSPKQRQVLTWWLRGQEDAVICDGAVRSGKTFVLSLSFFCWAMRTFRGQSFALCGKTIVSVRRNLLVPALPVLRQLGFRCEEKVSANLLRVRFRERENTFYLFGGKDEGSASLIQGITLAGALLDEVALMPRSFVEQTCARCSVPGSRMWFSCNPDTPEHWFYREWICKAEERNARYFHFTMDDNPALTPKVKKRYERAFQGTFYRRFVLGQWVACEGLVYDFFDESMVRPVPEGEFDTWCVSCDYGTANPASFGLWGRQKGVWYRVAEYYYDSRRERRQKTDVEYVKELEKLVGERKIELVVADPSAASFIEALRREGFRVVRADNEVLDGIRLTARLLRQGELVICEPCRDAVREFGLYVWAQRGGGQDAVKKENDHAMDDIRYFAATVAAPRDRSGGIAAAVVERSRF